MKIREIIAESQQTTEVELLKKLQNILGHAKQEIASNKKSILKLDADDIDKVQQQQQQQVLDEDFKSSLGKLALAGVIGLSGLSAKADQELGENLAKCSSVLLTASAFISKFGNDPAAAKMYSDAGLLSLNLATKHIDGDSANNIVKGANTILRYKLSNDDPTIKKEMLGTIEQCLKLMASIDFERTKQLGSGKSIASNNLADKEAQQQSNFPTQEATASLDKMRFYFYMRLGALHAVAKLSLQMPNESKQQLFDYLGRYKDGIQKNREAYDGGYNYMLKNDAAFRMTPQFSNSVMVDVNNAAEWIESMKSAMKTGDSILAKQLMKNQASFK